MIPKTSSVDEYASHIDSDKRPMFDHLRHLLLDMGFDEQIKWRMPVYSAHGRNAVWLGVFKLSTSLSFFEGNRIDDYLNILINAQEGKTEAMRHWRFSSMVDIDDDHIRAYLTQAIYVAATPIKKSRVKKETVIPVLLMDTLNNDPVLQAAFDTLSSFRQREYCEYIIDAKRVTTKEKRLAKVIPMIKEGLGLNDKYRK